jgi:putative transposase
VDRAGSRTVYCASPRAYPAKLPEVQYESGVTVRQVRHDGEIKRRGKLLYLSEVLAKEPAGFKPIDEARWELRYSFQLLGVLDERNKNIAPATCWHGAQCSKV